MQKHSKKVVHFIKLLLKAKSADLVDGDYYAVSQGARSGKLALEDCEELLSLGLISRHGDKIECSNEAGAWLRRHMSISDNAFADQHQNRTTKQTSLVLNTNESPLAQLSAIGGKKRFLETHHIEAGERFHRLFERAQLRKRTTMSYSAEQTVSSKRRMASSDDLTDMAMDARRQMEGLCASMPADCRGVLFDVCGFEKGLQAIEVERGWPRRSAKLVLRIGLEQLAASFGLSASAVGKSHKPVVTWMGEGAKPTKLG